MVGPGAMEEITFEQIGDGPPTMVVSGGGPGGFPPGLPPDLLRQLFPGPLSEGPGASEGHPFDAPDPLILDLLGGEDDEEGDLGIQRALMPMIRHAHAEGSQPDPGSCKQDIADKCRGQRSHVQCLGKNSDSISDACRRDVGKSVPFVCSFAIDRFCNAMQQGVRECLGQRLQELSGDCRDAVLATRHVIGRAKAAPFPEITSPIALRQYPPVPMPHVDGEHECASEGAVCVCRGGHVRYGHPGDALTEYQGHWSEWRPVEEYIHCDNGVFGDTCPHHDKRCVCRERDSPRQPSPDIPRQPSPGETPLERELLMDLELAKKSFSKPPPHPREAILDLELAKKSPPRSLGLAPSSEVPCPGCGRSTWAWRPFLLLALVLGGLGVFVASQEGLRMRLQSAVKQRGPESAGLLQGHVELPRHGGV